ncbi:MAG: hypothetical protein R3C28_29755 [Pirellulaceae bacterium]
MGGRVEYVSVHVAAPVQQPCRIEQHGVDFGDRKRHAYSRHITHINLPNSPAGRLATKVPTMLDTLALAYAQDGQFEQAARTLEDAISLAETPPNQKLLDSLRTKKAAYEEDRLPYVLIG